MEMSSQVQRLNVFLLVVLNSVLLLSARIIHVSTERCFNSKQCLSQEGVEILPCCSLEYVSQNTRTSCSNLTIKFFIDSDKLHLKGIATFEKCHNVSIIGRNKAMPSTISCEETEKEMTFLKNSEIENTDYMGNDLWKDIWIAYKSHRYSIFKHHYVQDDQLKGSGSLIQIDSHGFS